MNITRLATKATLTLPAIALLLAGCGTTDSSPEVAPDVTDVAATSTPSATTPPSPAAASAAAPTTIPDDVRLPHQDSWFESPEGAGRSPLPEICVDPPADLTDSRPTDAKSFNDTGTEGLPSESLAVYADADAAADAVSDWRERTAQCGKDGAQSHTGEPVEWYAEKSDVAGADEAWHGYELSEEVDGEDVSMSDPFFTVTRVGNAVFVETYTYPGRLDDATIAERVEAGTASAASFVPTLAPFAG